MYLALDPFRALSNGDLYWQRWLGDYAIAWHHLPTALGNETFTAAGASYVPQEWFISLLVAIAMRYHLLVPLAMLMAIIPIGILVSIYVRSRRAASPEAIAAVLLLTGVALVASFGIRAQVLGWGCFAAFLLCIERRDRWAYAAVPIVVVWANVHASVLLAPAYLMLRLAGAAFSDGLPAMLKTRDLRILALALPALLCTPLGWHLPAYAATLSVSPIRHYIEEWQPATFRDLAFMLGGLPLALLIAVAALRTRLRDMRQTLPAAALFVAMLLAVRNIPLFAIAAAPLAARSLDALLPSFRRIRSKIAEMERFALVSIGVAVMGSALFLARLQSLEPPPTSVAAIASLGDAGAPRRVFCEDFYACSAALGYPSLRVFIDGRADPYPLSVWRSYLSVIRLTPSWRRILGEYGVDAVLASRGDPFAVALSREPDWRRSFEGDGFVVFRHE